MEQRLRIQEELCAERRTERFFRRGKTMIYFL